MWVTSPQDHRGWSGSLPSQARVCRKGREEQAMKRLREGGREKKRRKMKIKKKRKDMRKGGGKG